MATNTNTTATASKAPASKAPASKAPAPAPASKAPAPAPASKAPAPAPAPAPANLPLPTTGVQWRHASGASGTVQAVAYMQACRALATWARGHAANTQAVHVVVHLGWHTGTGGRANVVAANSPAGKAATAAGVVGKPAVQVATAVLATLAQAGAPAAALATVRNTWLGKA